MTSTTMTFDTLMYAKKLKQARFTEMQAEIQAEALAEIMDSQLVRRQDLRELEIKLDAHLEKMELRIVFRVCSVVGIMLGLLAAFLKFTH
jgi:hypothetical protein